jgi:nucleoside phosphorylase
LLPRFDTGIASGEFDDGGNGPMAENPLVGMVMATMLEATSMIEKASLAKIADQPFPLYQGEDLVLVISGVGKTNAAMATTYCCLKYSPFWICNLGAAGATDYLYQPGEIYHIVKVIEYDRPHLRSDSPRIHLPYILPGFKTATLATQDRPVMDQEARKELAPLADLVDMEAAAVIQACRKFATPCVVFKFVSDTPAHSRHDEIVAHIKYYRSLLSDFCSKSVIPALRRLPRH